jgi:16S rRNA pseudouridine516 synthase
MSTSKRLDYILVHAGLGSRKEVKNLIKYSVVLVNNNQIKDPSIHIKEDDCITIDGKVISFKKNYYFMMNKPSGVISATFDPKEKTVIDLLSELDQKKNLFPVGRLDKDTEGLIFLTTDGKLAHEILSPNQLKTKVYHAIISVNITQEDIECFRNGIILDDGFKTAPANLEIIENNSMFVKISITEGKFHQIKRMFFELGKEVTYLKRISIDTLVLDENLNLGEYRELTTYEVSQLKGYE